MKIRLLRKRRPTTGCLLSAVKGSSQLRPGGELSGCTSQVLGDAGWAGCATLMRVRM